jgi:hypothetical protein
VLAEVGRPGSGPAKALGAYVEKPNRERLCWLTKAVLRSLGMETEGWERHVSVVEEAAAKFGGDARDRKGALMDCGTRSRPIPAEVDGNAAMDANNRQDKSSEEERER